MSDVPLRTLDLPEAIDAMLQAEQVKRVEITLNKDVTYTGPILSKGAAKGRYLVINAPLRKTLKLKDGDEVHVSLTPDESTYGLPMPDELGELLAIDEEANTLFHELTPGRQRRIIQISSANKTEETRLRKAVRSIDFLKLAGLKFDYGELEQYMRGKDLY
ncbi:MAG: YdeI/OmpD-associated family protein [Saprospiraceae bacterium]